MSYLDCIFLLSPSTRRVWIEIIIFVNNNRIDNGLVNICIVEKITKFDNDIFLDFRAAGKSFAGSTIRLRMACP